MLNGNPFLRRNLFRVPIFIFALFSLLFFLRQSYAAPLRDQAGCVILRISIPSNPGTANARLVEFLQEAIEKRAPGKIRIESLLSGKALEQGTELRAMGRGKIHFHFTSPADFYDYVSNYRNSPLLRGTNVEEVQAALAIQMYPFFIHGSAQMEQLMRNVDPIITPAMEKLGFVNLGSFYHGRRMIETTRLVVGINELNDKDLRMPSGTLWSLVGQSLLGPTRRTVVINHGGLRRAFERGQVKAIDVPLTSFDELGLMNQFRTIIETNHLYHYLYLNVSKAAFDQLTPDLQKVLREAAHEAISRNDAERINYEDSLLHAYRTSGTIRVLSLTRDERDFLKRQTEEAFLPWIQSPYFYELLQGFSLLK